MLAASEEGTPEAPWWGSIRHRSRHLRRRTSSMAKAQPSPRRRATAPTHTDRPFTRRPRRPLQGTMVVEAAEEINCLTVRMAGHW